MSQYTDCNYTILNVNQRDTLNVQWNICLLYSSRLEVHQIHIWTQIWPDPTSPDPAVDLVKIHIH